MTHYADLVLLLLVIAMACAVLLLGALLERAYCAVQAHQPRVILRGYQPTSDAPRSAPPTSGTAVVPGYEQSSLAATIVPCLACGRACHLGEFEFDADLRPRCKGGCVAAVRGIA